MTWAGYSTTADATADGWNVQGPIVTAGVGYGGAATSQTSWYAEKPVQCGGKFVVAAADSTSLVNAMNSEEGYQTHLGTNSPENSAFDGNI